MRAAGFSMKGEPEQIIEAILQEVKNSFKKIMKKKDTLWSTESLMYIKKKGLHLMM